LLAANEIEYNAAIRDDTRSSMLFTKYFALNFKQT